MKNVAGSAEENRISVRGVRLGFLSPTDVIQGQFQPAGNSNFIEYSEQIITDGVLTQVELLGDVPIGQTLGHETDNAGFPLGQKTGHFCAPGIEPFARGSPGQGVNHKIQFVAVGPNLTLRHYINALAKRLERFFARKYAPDPGSESFDDHGSLNRIQQHDYRRHGVGASYIPRHTKAGADSVPEVRADDCNIDRIFAETRAHPSRVCGVADDIQFIAATFHGRRHQLAIHPAVICYKDIHRGIRDHGLQHSLGTLVPKDLGM